MELPPPDDDPESEAGMARALAALDEIEEIQPELVHAALHKRLRYLLEHGWRDDS